jgi:hypothetical protein
VGRNGLVGRGITFWSGAKSGKDARFSASVLPVTVRADPSINFSFNHHLKNRGNPSGLVKVVHHVTSPTVLSPPNVGVRLAIRVKSANVNRIPKAWAMAIKVQHRVGGPAQHHHESNGVFKRRFGHDVPGRSPDLTRLTTARPACSHSAVFSADSAGCEELAGKLIPNVSMADAMVLAVYIPPHEPGPGHAAHSMSLRFFRQSSCCCIGRRPQRY